jgi:hypothetical protein
MDPSWHPLESYEGYEKVDCKIDLGFKGASVVQDMRLDVFGVVVDQKDGCLAVASPHHSEAPECFTGEVQSRCRAHK